MRLPLSLGVALSLAPGCVFSVDAPDTGGSPVDAASDTPIDLDAGSVAPLISEIPATPGRLASPELASSGLELFFTRVGDGGGFKIFVATRAADDMPWSEGKPILELSADESDPRLTADDLTMYLTSGMGGERDLFVAARASVDDFWNVPAPINLPLFGADYSLTTDPSGLSGVLTSETTGNADLYTVTALDSAPDLTLANELNTPLFDGNGDLSADGLTLYFASDRSGDRDLYMATRQDLDRPFSVPAPLGAINSSGYDGDPTVSADGRTLIFVSDRSGAARLHTATLVP